MSDWGRIDDGSGEQLYRCKLHPDRAPFAALDPCARCAAPPVLPADVEVPDYWRRLDRAVSLHDFECEYHPTVQFDAGEACICCLVEESIAFDHAAPKVQPPIPAADVASPVRARVLARLPYVNGVASMRASYREQFGDGSIEINLGGPYDVPVGLAVRFPDHALEGKVLAVDTIEAGPTIARISASYQGRRLLLRGVSMRVEFIQGGIHG